MKKLFAAILTVALALTPVGSYVFQEHSNTAEAKFYKSGRGSFNMNRSNNRSLFQNNNTNKSTSSYSNKSTYSKNATTMPRRGFTSGGFMKGLMLGGLAGLLFGGLFGNMGVLGSLLGLMVNVLAVVILIAIIAKIFTFFRDRKNKEANPWKK